MAQPTRFDVDLFVIGGGSGGVRAARIAAGHGARVMLAEEFRLGGTCVIRGCVPKKLLVMGGRFADAFEDSAGFGWRVAPPVFDWAALRDAKEREITRLEGLYARTQETAGVEVVKSRAVIESPHAVRLLGGGRTVTARHILVATGGAPNMPELPGIEHAISSNEAFDLPELPRSIMIAGGGYIALEFAGIFRAFGSEVTVIYRGDNVLRGFDEDVREALRAAYEKRGIRFLFNDVIRAIERSGAGGPLHIATRGGERIEADQVMMAIGRSPMTRGLGLEAVGVETDAQGAIKVDAFSKTSVDSIHAVGDVTNRVNLTPVAIREGHAFADTVFGKRSWTADHTHIPTAVFSTPEIGTIGLTEAQARAHHRIVDIYRTTFRPMRATLSGRDERALMKMVVDGETDRVLGVHVMGEGAGEMAQLLGVALRAGATKAIFDETVAVTRQRRRNWSPCAQEPHGTSGARRRRRSRPFPRCPRACRPWSEAC